jgi:hypothetical protein
MQKTMLRSSSVARLLFAVILTHIHSTGIQTTQGPSTRSKHKKKATAQKKATHSAEVFDVQ